MHKHGKHLVLGLEIAVAADLPAQGRNGLCAEAVAFFRVLGDPVLIKHHVSIKGPPTLSFVQERYWISPTDAVCLLGVNELTI